MTDATEKLLATIRHIMHDSLDDIDDRNRAVLEAVDEYVNSESRVRETWEAWNRQVAMLEAKARVCDAILASDLLPVVYDPKVKNALIALRALEKTR